MGRPDAELRRLLREAGLRATAARVSVLRALEGRGAPSSHPEVFSALREDGWDRATLYRNLVDMAEAGLLRRVELGDHVWRYELLSAPGHHDEAQHPHFLCTSCGDLSCLPEIELGHLPGLPARLRGPKVSVQFRGLCERCEDDGAASPLQQQPNPETP